MATTIRRSQVITTFGPGSLIDLPEHAAIVGGVDTWGDPVLLKYTPVTEDRLVRALQRAHNGAPIRLYSPPVIESDEQPPKGIKAFLFPQWFVEAEAPRERNNARIRRLVERRSLVSGKLGGGRGDKPSEVVPVRFVQACAKGHVSDIQWREFTHKGATTCRQGLALLERGTSGDLADLLVICGCGQSRPMSDAAVMKQGISALGECQGHRPWLGGGETQEKECKDSEGKPRQNRLLVRSASNAYFPILASAISMPDEEQVFRDAVASVRDDIESAEDESELKVLLKKASVKNKVGMYPIGKIWQALQDLKNKAQPEVRGVKDVELQTLLSTTESIGEDIPGGNFYATSVKMPTERTGAMRRIDRVVQVHRLREVVALVGFTRFEAPSRDIDNTLALKDLDAAALAQDVSWLPAVENRGEGVFFSLSNVAVEKWRGQGSVQRREEELLQGYNAWKQRHKDSKMAFPGVDYVLLHSLSHLLMNAVSLGCGYAASSIRERIYMNRERGEYGILLYTATSDAEGTLGGLVQVGKHLDSHLEQALRLGFLCANDPVCAQHQPQHPYEERFLHGAACHGCLFAPEPSCEWSNEFLDRSLVVPTVAELDAQLFHVDAIL